jgi:opacity protein-like surface antigen
MRVLCVWKSGVITLMSLAGLLIASTASAQTRLPPQANRPMADQGIGIGALGGWTNSTLNGSPEDEAGVEPRNDWMAGIWFGGNRAGRVGVMGEVNYTTKGAAYSDFGGGLKLTYLEIPALVRVNIGSRTREGTRFYGLAGPAFALLLKAVDQYPELEDLDVTDGYDKFDIGLMVGGGVEVRRIGVEVRANWGLTQLFEPTEGFEPIKNFQIQVVGKFRIN